MDKKEYISPIAIKEDMETEDIILVSGNGDFNMPIDPHL